MATYIPRHESQTDQDVPTPWTNCTFASGAMLVDEWTYGRKLTNDVVLRNLSGVPNHLGANFAQLKRAINNALALDLLYSDVNNPSNAPMTWRELRDHLSSDSGAVVAGSYQALRGWRSIDGKELTRWQPGGDFGHAMFVCDYRPDGDGAVLVMDPLGHGGYAGDRVVLTALWDFIWRDGNDENAKITAAHSFAGTRPAPGETRSERENRLAREVVTLRKRLPTAATDWQKWTGMIPDYRGQLHREMRLAAEVLYLRRMAQVER